MKKLHPNQIEKLNLQSKQIEVLASYAASEVFAEMGPYQPRAIREVAQQIGKTSAAVGEHVKKLVDAGLLIQVGTQKRRSRIEALYVHAAVENRLSTAGYPEIERKMYLDRFKGQMRLLERQHETFQHAAFDDAEIKEFFKFQNQYVYLSPENTQKIKAKIAELSQLALSLNEADADKRASDHCIRVNVSAIVVPTQVESRKRIKSQGDA